MTCAPRRPTAERFAHLRKPSSDDGEMRFLDAIRSYMADVTPTKAPSTQRDHALYARTVAQYLDARRLSELPVDQLDVPTVYDLHRALRDTPVEANRIKTWISQVCDHAERLGARPANSNPTRAVRNYPETPETRFLGAGQRAAFIDACHTCVLAGEVTVAAACACLLMLLGGLRLHEATRLEWSEADLDAGVIRLQPRHIRGSNKSREDRARPISDDVVRVLRSMPRHSRWVCPNPRTGLPYRDLRCAMRAICGAAGLSPHTTRHMLRHSFATALAENEFTAEMIAKWLGQRYPGSAQRYLHLTSTALRKHAARVAEAVRGGRPGREAA